MIVREPTFRRGARLIVRPEMVAVAAQSGFALYDGDVYVVERDSASCSECSVECNYRHPEDPTELVFLVENGDGEPCTHYDVKLFDKTRDVPQHVPFWHGDGI